MWFLALVLLLPALAQAYDLLVVMDQHSKIYDTLLLGFRNSHHFKERVIVLQDYAENDLVRIVREDHPATVLTIGGKALDATHKISNTPIVSVFSYGIQLSDPPSNLVQIKLQAKTERYAALFHALGAKRVGTVFSHGSSRYVAEATDTFRHAGIHLVTREASTPGEVAKQLETLKDKVDALWLLPDPKIVTSETVEVFVLSSLRNRLPLVSFTEAHLKKGAAAAFAIDLEDLGKQAAETVSQIMAGDSPAEIEEIPPRKIRLRFNRQVMEHLGFPVSPLLHLGGSEAE
jgi:putative ABC transport system substrate-binding protein